MVVCMEVAGMLGVCTVVHLGAVCLELVGMMVVGVKDEVSDTGSVVESEGEEHGSREDVTERCEGGKRDVTGMKAVGRVTGVTSRLAHSPVHGKLPPIPPAGFERWLRKLEWHSELQGWSSQSKLLQFELHLGSRAEQIYEVLPGTHI